MVRLMLVLAPVMCILAGIAVNSALSSQMKYLDAPRQSNQQAANKRKAADTSIPFRSEVAWGFTALISIFLVRLSFFCTQICSLIISNFQITYTFHCTWVTSEAYSSPSIVLSARGHDGSRIIFDDFREAYYWLRMNTPEVTSVPSEIRFIRN